MSLASNARAAGLKILLACAERYAFPRRRIAIPAVAGSVFRPRRERRCRGAAPVAERSALVAERLVRKRQ